jgi:hypothetical protein
LPRRPHVANDPAGAATQPPSERPSDHPEGFTLASPYFGEDSLYFLERAQLDVKALELYWNAVDPAATHKLNGSLFQPQSDALPLGSTVSLATFFILGAGTTSIPDWNIDADRGYAFKYWRHSGDLNVYKGFTEGKYLKN